jgi:hypothetical protein
MLRYLVMAPIGNTLGKRKWTPQCQADTGLALQRSRASRSILAQAAGTSIGAQDNLVFVARTSMIERMQLTHVAKGYERMMWCAASFRMDSVRGKRELRHTGGTG